MAQLVLNDAAAEIAVGQETLFVYGLSKGMADSKNLVLDPQRRRPSFHEA